MALARLTKSSRGEFTNTYLAYLVRANTMLKDDGAIMGRWKSQVLYADATHSLAKRDNNSGA